MRITTTSVRDFTKNLKTGSPFQGRVYFERSTRPMNGKNRLDATSFEVILQLSTVLEFGDGSQALLVCGVVCGIDRLTADGNKDGSLEQENRLIELREFCGSRGWTLLPGALDQ